jgi:sulfate-transporting ATPase
VQLAVVDQTRESLPNDKTVWEAISSGQDILTVGRFEMPSRAYLGRFNFKGGDQQKIVGQLSGGERGRLHLAATLLKGGNVLLLDEPSNDLDVETLRALEDALLEFAGSALVISHDRWFLDRIATHILAAEGDSQWSFFVGNIRNTKRKSASALARGGRRTAFGIKLLGQGRKANAATYVKKSERNTVVEKLIRRRGRSLRFPKRP